MKIGEASPFVILLSNCLALLLFKCTWDSRCGCSWTIFQSCACWGWLSHRPLPCRSLTYMTLSYCMHSKESSMSFSWPPMWHLGSIHWLWKTLGGSGPHDLGPGHRQHQSLGGLKSLMQTAWGFLLQLFNKLTPCWLRPFLHPPWKMTEEWHREFMG